MATNHPCRDGPTAAQPAKDRAWVGSFETISGREVHQLYGPNDLTGCDYEKQLGDPGWFPFTRGVHADMYRGRLWTMRQFTGFGTAEQTNKRFRFLLDKGQTGLSVAFDLPTLMGFDSDDPQAASEVGRLGVAVDRRCAGAGYDRFRWRPDPVAEGWCAGSR